MARLSQVMRRMEIIGADGVCIGIGTATATATVDRVIVSR